ncbi:MAG: DNA methyltransferase [Polyangia bacterium]
MHHADAIAWMQAQGRIAGASVVTSLPDLSELPRLGPDGWRRWFVAAAQAAMRSIDDGGVAVFFQSDIRHHGVWIDKGALVADAAAAERMSLLFHKIVCRLPPGTPTAGRASYAHLLGFARTPRPPRRATADVLPDGGFLPGPRAMGVNACREACELVRRDTPTRTVVDPFCGWGTVLAVANALGLDAIGVDHSARMCKKARLLQLDLARAHEPQPRSVAP